ncbi:MAG TPA: hypothetical protein VMA95_20425 [Streptosporangiaceae bacterium]|nr:hypothetical protein [Streptosporangiaceae bacterium]
MSLWRIRLDVPDDPQSQALLNAALADQRVWTRVPSDADADADAGGDVIIELPRDDRLGALLNDLHRISPHVFVSSVDQPPITVGGEVQVAAVSSC